MSKNEHDVTSPMGHPDDKEKNLAVQHFDQHSHSESHTMTMNDMDPNTLRKPGEDRFDHVLSPEERTTALRLAMEADPGPDILSWRYMLFVFTAFIAILNSGDNGESTTQQGNLSVFTVFQLDLSRCSPGTGFDGTVMSSVNSMEQFQNFFGLDGAAAGGTSLVFVSLPQLVFCVIVAKLCPGSLHRRSSLCLLPQHLPSRQGRKTMGNVHPQHPSMVSHDPPL